MKVRVAFVALSLAAWADPAVAQNFSGLYGGVTGGYAFNGKAPMSGGAIVDFDDIKTSQAGGLVGYNFIYGPLLLGMEARGQYAFDAAEVSATSGPVAITPIGSVLQTTFSLTPTTIPNFNTNFTLASGSTQSTRLSKPFSSDVSLRAGGIVGEWLLFAKVGGGLEYLSTSSTYDSVATKTCNNPVVPTISTPTDGIFQNQQILTGCGSITSGTVSTTKITKYSGVVVLGVGVERNFGPLFLRAEAEMISHLGSKYAGDQSSAATTAYYTPAANVTLGYRF